MGYYCDPDQIYHVLVDGKVDASGAAQTTSVFGSFTSDVAVESVHVSIVDSAINPGGYGGLGVLTNGIGLYVLDADATEHTVFGFTTTADLASAATDVTMENSGSGWLFIARIDFRKLFGGPLHLDRTSGKSQTLTLELYDNFTGLDEHNWHFFAHRVPKAGPAHFQVTGSTPTPQH